MKKDVRIRRMLAEKHITRRQFMVGASALGLSASFTQNVAIADYQNCLCNFLRTPTAEEQFKINGLRPSEIPAETRELFRRLSLAMKRNRTWDKPLQDGLAEWENPGIPAGYTYLAQLVGHDLVHSALDFPDFDRDHRAANEPFRNLRSVKLDLDTLYGAGPSAVPHAYALSDSRHRVRTKLGMGSMRWIGGKDGLANGPSWRDISRTSAPGGNGVQRKGLTRPLIVDPRNDNNSNLSQLLTVFMHLHNGLVDAVAKASPRSEGQTEEEWNETVFSDARRIMERLYRNVVQNDLMKRILHPDVHAHYNRRNPTFIDNRDGASMPMEFSQATYRFGHAMVRPSYKMANDKLDVQAVGDVLLTNSENRPWNMPLDQTWIIQWPLFFDFNDGLMKNPSRRIGPSLAGDLVPVRAPGAESENEPQNLGHRDLLRGATTGLWSIEALIRAIGDEGSPLIAKSKLASDFRYARSRMMDWLKDSGEGILSESDIAAIAKDPPFSFYILFEAAEESDGKHLGVLGSIIVAETVFKALKASVSDAEHSPRIEGLMAGILGNEPVNDMASLITHTARLAGLEDAYPRFI